MCLRPWCQVAANVNKTDLRTGSTPLRFAAFTRNKRTVGFLKHSARVDVRSSSRMTPLHQAQSQTGDLHVAELLLDERDEKMVCFIVGRHATVNIQGPGVAAQSTRKKISMIESLLRFFDLGETRGCAISKVQGIVVTLFPNSSRGRTRIPGVRDLVGMAI